MKIFLSILCSIIVSLSLFAQAKGNMQRVEGYMNIDDGKTRSSNDYQNSYAWNSVQFKNEIKDFQINNNNEVEIDVKVLMNVKADKYLAMFNLTQVGESAEEADKIWNERFTGLKTALSALGIKEEDIYVDMISLIPLYEYEVEKKLFSKNYVEKPSGFELSKNVHILFMDSKQLEPIVTAAAKNEIYDLIKVDYYVVQGNQVMESMTDAASDFLAQRMEIYKEMGLNLDTSTVRMADEFTTIYPLDRYQSYNCYSQQKLKGVSADKITSVRKPVTYFYNKLPYNDFDVVLNPVVLEPAVQYIYQMKVKFILTNPSIKVKEKEYYLITPNGEMRLIDPK